MYLSNLFNHAVRQVKVYAIYYEEIFIFSICFLWLLRLCQYQLFIIFWILKLASSREWNLLNMHNTHIDFLKTLRFYRRSQDTVNVILKILHYSSSTGYNSLSHITNYLLLIFWYSYPIIGNKRQIYYEIDSLLSV